MKIIILSSGLLISFLLLSCHSDTVVPAPLTSIIKNFAADPTTGYDPTTGAPIGDKKLFSFFRFSDSSIISHSDSATDKWDIGFRASEIILNGGSSGPSNCQGFAFNGSFDQLLKVPEDSIFKLDNRPNLVIGNSWSSYNPQAMILNSIPGKCFVLKTANNNYVKFEIISYYKNAPSAPNAFVDQARYYTFRYTYSAGGSKTF